MYNIQNVATFINMLALNILFLFTFVLQINAKSCPSGSPIHKIGISKQGKIDVVKYHNKYRRMIMDGNVSGQPRGKNLKTMVFDENLANEGRVVSMTCKMNHIIGSDNRWNWVGQNLFIQWSSEYSENQDWEEAVKSWFSEHKDYEYPYGSRNMNAVGHYTQLVWANSYALGCDFILFEDAYEPSYPYAKLYTCNYGPGGNYEGEAPYPRA